MSTSLEKLPYSHDALEPHMSRRTLEFHYDRHHRGYIDKLNNLVKGTAYDGMTVEDIIAKARQSGDVKVFNNAAQAWNHAFFWNSMSPNGGTPDGQIKQHVEAAFKDVEQFKKAFREAASGIFGSGWVWLVLDGDRLRIISTENAETPAGTRLVPLLTLDVWEHAYYLDHQNERGRFVDTFLENLVNWNFAAANIEASVSRKVA